MAHALHCSNLATDLPRVLSFLTAIEIYAWLYVAKTSGHMNFLLILDYNMQVMTVYISYAPVLTVRST